MPHYHILERVGEGAHGIELKVKHIQVSQEHHTCLAIMTLLAPYDYLLHPDWRAGSFEEGFSEIIRGGHSKLGSQENHLYNHQVATRSDPPFMIPAYAIWELCNLQIALCSVDFPV